MQINKNNINNNNNKPLPPVMIKVYNLKYGSFLDSLKYNVLQVQQCPTVFVCINQKYS